eukprot:2008140-Pleurochrysis_carterae.AAC.1
MRWRALHARVARSLAYQCAAAVGAAEDGVADAVCEGDERERPRRQLRVVVDEEPRLRMIEGAGKLATGREAERAGG